MLGAPDEFSRVCWGDSTGGAGGGGRGAGGCIARLRPTAACPCHPHPDYRCSSSCSTSASVFRSFVTEKAPNELAIERASIRSVLLLTTPSSVTWPFSTMTWIGGLAIDP